MLSDVFLLGTPSLPKAQNGKCEAPRSKATGNLFGLFWMKEAKQSLAEEGGLKKGLF